jgi:5'-3' exonuclease
MIDLIVDGNSLFARSWFAAAHASGANDPTKAILFAASTLLNLLNPNQNFIGIHFNRSLFAWDTQQNEAKQRHPKPPEYHATKEVFIEMLSTMLKTAHYAHENYEGDDIVATAVYNSKSSDTVYAVSGDKDLMQLEGGNCRYYCLNTKAVLSAATITNKFKIKRSSQVALALAIIGDPVDKVMGIYGWGPKRVQRLFASVTKDMNFAQAFQVIDQQVPENLKTSFYEALERVLLKTNVPGVPFPAKLVFAKPSIIDNFGLPELSFKYSEVYDCYT